MTDMSKLHIFKVYRRQKWLIILGCCVTVSYILWLHKDKKSDVLVQSNRPTRNKEAPLKKSHLRQSWGKADEVKVIVSDRVARNIASQVSILCLVISTPNKVETSALAVNQTWGKRCNRLLFVSTLPMGDLPHIVVQATPGWDHLTSKTMAMFKYAATYFSETFDWFLKIDDDTFVVMENLRYLLKYYDPSDPVYLGHHFKRFVRQGYMSGGAGYVISSKALHVFHTNSAKCKSDGWAEDIDFGDCMEKIGVAPSSSKDIHGRNSFHAVSVLEELTWISYIKEHAKQVKEPIFVGPSCCSQLSITFHKVTPQLMYLIEFLLYRMSLYGRNTPDNMFTDFFHIGPIEKGNYVPDTEPHFS